MSILKMAIKILQRHEWAAGRVSNEFAASATRFIPRKQNFRRTNLVPLQFTISDAVSAKKGSRVVANMCARQWMPGTKKRPDRMAIGPFATRWCLTYAFSLSVLPATMLTLS
jgi:hypothetical protein